MGNGPRVRVRCACAAGAKRQYTGICSQPIATHTAHMWHIAYIAHIAQIVFGLKKKTRTYGLRGASRLASYHANERHTRSVRPRVWLASYHAAALSAPTWLLRGLPRAAAGLAVASLSGTARHCRLPRLVLGACCSGRQGGYERVVASLA
jgi:hypothetical protein